MGKIGEYISKQCGNPHGIIGKIMVWSMNRVNKAMYEGIVNEIEVRENLRILDVGFGNGYLEKLIMKKGKLMPRKIHIIDICWQQREG